jgi:glutamate racemase
MIVPSLIPYGIRLIDTVIKYALECAHFLAEFGIDLLVLGCNTVSAKESNILKKEFPHLEIFGVVEPAVEKVVEVSTASIGIIRTPATVKSDVYRKGIKKRKPTLKVLQKTIPLFVPFAETVLNHYF